MKTRLTFTQRIALSYILLAMAVAGAFSVVSYIAVEYIEEQVIDQRLLRMTDQLVELHASKRLPEAPADIHFLINADIPAELQPLDDGVHELRIGKQAVRALLREVGENRYAVLQDVDEFHQTERVIFLSLLAGFAVSSLFAAVLGVLTARRMIAPVSALAAAVDRGAPAADLSSLSARDEIGVLARAFARRTEELQRFLQREQLFTGDVSHELRTPLTIMLGAAEVLTTQLSDRPAQHAVAERIRRVAAEAAQRVSALLLLSRAPESMDAPRTLLNAVIQSELDRYSPLLEGKDVRYSMEWTGPVYVDVRPELAGIVIGNLLRNACQHTDQGTILVQLEPDRLVIEDSGTGIPQAVRERLFERFIQGVQPTHEGTGLGLSIVKRVVEHIGWEVRLETPQTRGSRFVLTFPAARTVSA